MGTRHKPDGIIEKRPELSGKGTVHRAAFAVTCGGKCLHKGGKETKSIPMLKAYSVFNLAQLENLPAIYNAAPEKIPDDVKLDCIQGMVTASGIPVQYGADSPKYYPGPDRVMMPNYSAFNSADDFVSTLGHELVHATGHKDRLARKFNAKLFKDAYATEELHAELGSAFLCAYFGYSYIEAQSPAYLEGWLKALKADNRAIFSIASYASQTADWLLNRGKEEEKVEQEYAIPY